MDDLILQIARLLLGDYDESDDDGVYLGRMADAGNVYLIIEGGVNYRCYVVLASGSISNWVASSSPSGEMGWTPKFVLCEAVGGTPEIAKQAVFDKLIKRAKDIMNLPIKDVMES